MDRLTDGQMDGMDRLMDGWMDDGLVEGSSERRLRRKEISHWNPKSIAQYFSLCLMDG